MKKFIPILLIAILSLLLMLSVTNSSKKDIVTTKAELESVIIEYINALPSYDVETLKKLSTVSHMQKQGQSNNNTNTNINFKEILKSARLQSADIVSFSEDTVRLFCKVELVCYDNAVVAGDWYPGTSLNEKTFELKKVNGEWKINSWQH